MGNTSGTAQWRAIMRSVQRRDFADRPVAMEQIVGVHDRKPGGVIAPIFKSAEPLKQYG